MAWLILVLTWAVMGCDLFRTRDAEPPDTGRRTWEAPRVPEDVLTNLAAAMMERDAVNYLRSFNSEDFTFEADQAALARDPSLAQWHYSEEAQHAARLFTEGTLPRDSILSVVFSSLIQSSLADSAEIHARYDLAAGVAIAGVPHRMAGTADFYLRMGGEGYWEIYRWRDTRTEDASTWSDLKSLVR